MTPYQTSWLIWGAWLACVIGSFLLLEIPAVRDVVPWNTMTWTYRQTFTRHQWFGLLFVGFLAVLTAHMFWKRAKKNDPEGRN